MSDNQEQPEKKRGVGAPQKYDRKKVTAYICSELKTGRSLMDVCEDPGMPPSHRFLDWMKEDDDIAKEYALAREVGYSLLADQIIKISDKTHEWVTTQEKDKDGNLVFNEDGTPKIYRALMPLSADTVAHKRVQIDTRKWMLSKMLPKIYGDRITQEHTGANGGPIALAAVDLKNLSDDELSKLNDLLAKSLDTKK